MEITRREVVTCLYIISVPQSIKSATQLSFGIDSSNRTENLNKHSLHY